MMYSAYKLNKQGDNIVPIKATTTMVGGGGWGVLLNWLLEKNNDIHGEKSEILIRPMF